MSEASKLLAALPIRDYPHTVAALAELPEVLKTMTAGLVRAALERSEAVQEAIERVDREPRGVGPAED